MSNLEKTLASILILYVINFVLVVNKIFILPGSKELIFWILPVLSIYSIAAVKGRLKFPYFVLFLVLCGWFVANETTLFRSEIVPDYTYIIGVIKFYTIYIAFNYLCNTRNRQIWIMKTYVKLSIPFIALFYLNYLGLVQLTDEVGYSHVYQRYLTGDLVNPNAISLVAALAIIDMIIIKTYYEPQWISNRRLYYSIGYFMAIIMLHATRGAFLIVILCLVYYFYIRRNEIISMRNIIGISILVLVAIGLDYLAGSLILNRFLEVDYETLGRTEQILASTYNFMNNPWFGAGYSNAGYSSIFNTERSNFHYTQVLASTGIFWSILYFYLIYKMLVNKSHRDIMIYSAIFGLLALAFENWNNILTVSFIAAFEPKVNKL